MTKKVSLAIHQGEHIADELAARERTDLREGDTALRLAKVVGTSAEFWMRLQVGYDLAPAREARAA